MDKEEFEKFRKDRYEKEVNWYDKEANNNHTFYDILQWIAIILAAITPVLVVIGGDYKWVATVVAILAAIAAGALRAFKYQENWINYRTTCETLRKEWSYYKAGIEGYEGAQDKEALFVQRVERLISRENTLWLTTCETGKNEKNNIRS